MELTERELEVLKLLCQGYGDEKIAQTLNITVSTVKSHIHNILQKLNIKDRVKLVVYAIRNEQRLMKDKL